MSRTMEGKERFVGRCTRVGRSAVSKVWRFNINIDLGKAKELTLAGILGGVLTAVLVEGAGTITHLIVGHSLKRVAIPSDENRSAAPKQARTEPLSCAPWMPFSDRWQSLFDFPRVFAPVSFESWWLFPDGFSANTPSGPPHPNSRVRDHPAPVEATRRK